jgi:hypothetical protein
MMTDDLVKRLRRDLASGLSASIGNTKNAAERIEELQAALQNIETLELDPRNSGQMWVEALRQIARKALGETEDD